MVLVIVIDRLPADVSLATYRLSLACPTPKMTAWPTQGSGRAMSQNMAVTGVWMASAGVLPLVVVGREHGGFL